MSFGTKQPWWRLGSKRTVFSTIRLFPPAFLRLWCTNVTEELCLLYQRTMRRSSPVMANPIKNSEIHLGVFEIVLSAPPSHCINVKKFD